MHHLSYCGPDERIVRKITTWGHKDEVLQGWYERVWKAWDSNPLLRDIHPTHPQAYGFAERIEVPEILRRRDEQAPVFLHPKPDKWPAVSVVIPVLNNLEDIRLCLESLHNIRDLVHEVVVIDNGSGTPTEEFLKRQDWIKLLRNETNLGFGRASNQGVEASSGEVVVFLNSDTVVPRAGFFHLVSALISSGSIGATGPVSNNVGYYQRVASTYTSLANLGRFADFWSSLPASNEDVDMLVGFCLAVKRHVLEEVGLFDDRFGPGLFEDTDLCYRIQRGGYRLVVARKAFVHHTGSKTLTQVSDAPVDLLKRNEREYYRKWQSELSSGFASHLPGGPDARGPVWFDRSKDPSDPQSEIGRLRSQADVTLCMIVRNEERVLSDCLASATPFFKQIVVVDTGSTDRTIEIAKSFGVELHEIVWPDSFAEARNESLKHAKGKWVFWIDADDTVPWQTGLSVLGATIQAPPSVVGFVVPVQFIEDGPGGGTRVDHVKLFRNVPGVSFEGRIHEQVLASLRPYGEIARIGAVVLHSGYDTSAKGQANKRERDWKLLELDLADRPGHPFVLFNFGMTHHFCDQHEEAVVRFRECLAVSEPVESHVRKAYALLGLSLKRLGRIEDAKCALHDGLEAVGEDPELRFHLAMLASEEGDWEGARANYEAIPGGQPGHFSSIDVGVLSHKRDFNLAGVLLQLGQYDEAKRAYIAAFTENPLFIEAAEALFFEALDRSDFETAVLARNHVQQLLGYSEKWASLTFAFYERLEGFESAVDYLQSMLSNPERVTAALPVLARNLLRSGQESRAIPFATELAGRGYAEFGFYLGVAASRVGNLGEALVWFEHALQLNPAHDETLHQITIIKNILSVGK